MLLGSPFQFPGDRWRAISTHEIKGIWEVVYLFQFGLRKENAMEKGLAALEDAFAGVKNADYRNKKIRKNHLPDNP